MIWTPSEIRNSACQEACRTKDHKNNALLTRCPAPPYKRSRKPQFLPAEFRPDFPAHRFSRMREQMWISPSPQPPAVSHQDVADSAEPLLKLNHSDSSSSLAHLSDCLHCLHKSLGSQGLEIPPYPQDKRARHIRPEQRLCGDCAPRSAARASSFCCSSLNSPSVALSALSKVLVN